jgi:hypothetical protein
MCRCNTYPPGAVEELLNHSFGWAMNPSFLFFYLPTERIIMTIRFNDWVNTHKFVVTVTIIAVSSLIRIHDMKKNVVILSQDLHGL